MGQILVSWIGGNDLKAVSQSSTQPALGPLLSTLLSNDFTKAYFLFNYPKKDVDPYLNWLKSKTNTDFEAVSSKLSSPIHFGDIHKAAVGLLERISNEHPDDVISILLSPGTPAMQAVWILLGKTKYPAVFYQSSVEQGVQQVSIPFDISAEFLPELEARSGRQVASMARAEVSISAAFDDILTNNPAMNDLKAEATLMAVRDVPVLIYGETGTGKELFATAIHNASVRADKPFVPVNCGAIPSELIDSLLFGHVKGAFTGATGDKLGYFDEADGGTLFLDEFGELPSDAQVRLLRVIQSGELIPVGSTKTRKVDVRIITATNRNLLDDVVTGKFREDLFYRIAVGVLHLPPLRERKGDIGMLAENLLAQINRQAASLPGYKDKIISTKAKNIIIRHPWMGNVRELHSTLLRATIWSKAEEISESDINRALFKMPEKSEGILGRDIDNNFNIQSVIDEVQVHYIKRALDKAAGKKKKAAEFLGIPSYQTLSNWMKNLGIK